MNTAVTSKEEILRVSRDFLQRQGWESINIRTIAKECKISVDSIYNYFQNKTDLITATVESVWHPLHCTHLCFHLILPKSVFSELPCGS